MNRQQSNLPSRWLIVGALAIFLGTAFLGIALNSTVFRHGLDISESISHYVGLEIWSAIVFTIGNIFVAMLVSVYLWKLGEAWRMPKVFYVLIVVLVASLMGLSVCPAGMFDAGESTSLITWVHIITSRTMFIAMMVIAALIVICKHANTLAHVVNVLYLVYAVICIVGFVSEAEWFMSCVMVLETMYLAGFMFAIAVCDERPERIADLHEDMTM